jgi:hypothetical protein
MRPENIFVKGVDMSNQRAHNSRTESQTGGNMTDEKFRDQVRAELAADIAQRRRDDGGPAFPHERQYGAGTVGVAEGMTLRAYFAGKALEGSMANPSAVFTPSKAQMDAGVTWTQIMAKECVKAADELIKELSK